jgi:hypothetical protein
MPPRTSDPLAGQAHAPHAMTCVRFWVWPDPFMLTGSTVRVAAPHGGELRAPDRAWGGSAACAAVEIRWSEFAR